MSDYKTMAISLIQREAEKLEAYEGSEVVIDDFEQCHDSDLSVVVKGSLTVESIEYDEGNMIDGYWETLPSDYIAKWSFDGVVTVEDEDCRVIETIEITDNDLDNE